MYTIQLLYDTIYRPCSLKCICRLALYFAHCMNPDAFTMTCSGNTLCHEPAVYCMCKLMQHGMC